MESKYAYLRYKQDIHTEEMTKSGKVAQFELPMKKGHTDLVSVSTYNRFMKDFPDSVAGKVISQDNLLNMVRLCYDELKKEIADLPNVNSDVERRFHMLREEFERGGMLYPTKKDDRSIEDLASKVFYLQQAVRKNQYSAYKKSGQK